MKYIRISLWVLFAGMLIISCSKSNEVQESNSTTSGNGGTSSCNTTNMKFSADIVPILQSNCYSCHSNANKAISGISLEGYSNVKAKVDDGRLIGAITHASGFSAMPQGGAKLSDCIIQKIQSWINS